MSRYALTLWGALLMPVFAVQSGVVAQAPLLRPVSTTKVLAIGSLVAPLDSQQRKSIMAREVPETVKLYLAGKIDQWYVRQDGKGVVFLLNLNSVEEAKTLLEQLPLGQAKQMTFEYLPLGPLSPLGLLLTN